jgi:hypothetical protein
MLPAGAVGDRPPFINPPDESAGSRRMPETSGGLNPSKTLADFNQWIAT